MKEIKGRIEIDAPSDRVWKAATDFASYPKWNPWITSMSGELKVGGAIEATALPPGKKAMRLKSKVIRIEPGKDLLLESKVMGGLLNDEHLISVEPIGPHETRFFQRVRFHGLMVPLVGGAISSSQIGLEEMNKALKRICEAEL